ncbi:hypothetical protein FQ192_10675 [Pseudomonas sp. ANT_J12]|uniref:hypothetical protein n=1 Tax=Pseudomonas sp. ANT_J12 TaxID=2597351 RepID=UPI0011F339F6|nr:hypothetical protein [Pseudomonas sp. ANT_J12]KAA0995494.1 hypothetical protein FQ192_10675 [Pseudomonas sp. ANT_J12]
MISNHLSMVEAMRPASDELAAKVAQYLAAGGHIEEAAPIGYKPKPIIYSNQMPPAPKPFIRRRVEAAPLPLDRDDIREQARLKLLEKMRQLSKTHTQTQAAEALSMSRQNLSKIASANGIDFKNTGRGGARGAAYKAGLEARDAKIAERIRAFLELGVTRRQCCGRLAIGNKAFERIITAHGIDYPKARRGTTSCAA